MDFCSNFIICSFPKSNVSFKGLFQRFDVSSKFDIVCWMSSLDKSWSFIFCCREFFKFGKWCDSWDDGFSLHDAIEMSLIKFTFSWVSNVVDVLLSSPWFESSFEPRKCRMICKLSVIILRELLRLVAIGERSNCSSEALVVIIVFIRRFDRRIIERYTIYISMVAPDIVRNVHRNLIWTLVKVGRSKFKGNALDRNGISKM